MHFCGVVVGSPLFNHIYDMFNRDLFAGTNYRKLLYDFIHVHVCICLMMMTSYFTGNLRECLAE